MENPSTPVKMDRKRCVATEIRNESNATTAVDGSDKSVERPRAARLINTSAKSGLNRPREPRVDYERVNSSTRGQEMISIVPRPLPRDR